MDKLRCLLFLFVLLLSRDLLAMEPPLSGKYWLFLGTYTSDDGSKGIYRCSLDAATGKLGDPEVAMAITNPSFLHISPDGRSLYSVGESAPDGSVHSFKLDLSTGMLSDQVSLTSGGPGACHISTDKQNQFAVVSNYSDGSYAFFKLKPDGSIDSRIAYHRVPLVKVDGKERKALGHCGAFNSTGEFAFTCDAGQDKLHLFRLDREMATVSINDPSSILMPASSAPRHIHIADDDSVAFVNGEHDMTVNLVKLDTKSNRYEVVQSLSTLRAGEQVQNGDSTAECRIHPNGRFVYVSNRGHNTIAVFKFDAVAAKLSPVGHITGDIKIPRNFNISPCGRWMLIASQDGGKVGVFEIDQETGLANETSHVVAISRCVCIKFVSKL